MFKHLLLATDGSELSLAAARHALELAQAIGARATAVEVVEPYPYAGVGEAWQPSRGDRQDHLAAQRRSAETAFADIGAIAKERGVPLEAVTSDERDVAKAIVDAASACGADLIVMGSHGRSGIAKAVLGSVAAKVLVLSTVPVLVVR
ncbi:universal stress protein [Piscinibacter sp.]|uniref:universal stress protein n=1 Tax=Piscinibacter sp. TaxID=1903157 RepID=UPI002C0EAEE3|nr:universal stress protein [Albitalea sp.]HUG21525.1 universal stress protein [Albitalea sp.]